MGDGGHCEQNNEPVETVLFEEPICHCGAEGNFGCDAHIDPEVPQREQHFAVRGTFTSVGDRSARLRGTCDVEQRAFY
jgi:hypothetical protein